jgi:hypothetical protein
VKSRDVALGGVLAALAVVFLVLGGAIGIGTFAGPMLASLLLIPLLDRLPLSGCVGWYAVAALLGSLLCPDRETAAIFVLLGWYPIGKRRFDRLPHLPRLLVKLAVFHAAIAAAYAVLILLFRLESLVRELRETAPAWLVGLLLVGNAAFFFYDLVLTRLSTAWHLRFGRKGPPSAKGA